jgi:hypothetical protein
MTKLLGAIYLAWSRCVYCNTIAFHGYFDGVDFETSPDGDGCCPGPCRLNIEGWDGKEHRHATRSS